MKRLFIYFLIVNSSLHVYSQDFKSWINNKVTVNVSSESQFSFDNNNIHISNTSGDFGVKITPEFSVKYCTNFAYMHFIDTENYVNTYQYGISNEYVFRKREKSDINFFRYAVEGKLLYGNAINSNNFENWSYSIGMKIMPSICPYLYLGVGFYQYFYKTTTPDLTTGYFSFGIRY